jgi:two-component system chemotaxis sensor kinase CheA
MRETGKRVKVEISGQHTEIDKLVVEKMMEPLLHLVRNAVSHGIESPEERAAAGKAAEGKLRLSAATAGDTVVIEIEDDGHGIRIDKVTARARAMGLIDNKNQRR